VDERIQGITSGADDFLTKPVNRQELLARTRSLLRIKEYTDELENAETIVHDIGKIAVPDSILLKSGPLTADEWVVMKEHPVVGERICSPLKSFRFVLPIIRHHHEKLNGSGYPDGLEGDQIPLTARIMQVTDVYDALTTNRPYRASLTRERAFEIMREEVSRGWWDGDLVNTLQALVVETNIALCGTEAAHDL
jgi:putative two-component system response regulator